MVLKRVLRQFLPPIVVLIVALVGFELYVRHLAAQPHPKFYRLSVPRPTAMLRVLIDNRSEMFAAMETTTKAALLGFAASVVVGILAAMILSTSSLVRRAFYPYTVFFQTVPIVAIAPMLVIWSDAGLRAVAIIAFIVSVFPVIANTLTGLLSVEPALSDLFRLYGAGPIARLWKLKLPSALPGIFSGLRVASGLAVIGTVVAEFFVGNLGDNEGLGVKIVTASHYAKTDKVFAAVLLTSVLGLALFAGVNAVGYFMLRRWHASEQ